MNVSRSTALRSSGKLVVTSSIIWTLQLWVPLFTVLYRSFTSIPLDHWWRNFVCTRWSVAGYQNIRPNPSPFESTRNSARRCLLWYASSCLLLNYDWLPWRRPHVVWSGRSWELGSQPKRRGMVIRSECNTRSKTVSAFSVPRAVYLSSIFFSSIMSTHYS